MVTSELMQRITYYAAFSHLAGSWSEVEGSIVCFEVVSVCCSRSALVDTHANPMYYMNWCQLRACSFYMCHPPEGGACRQPSEQVTAMVIEVSHCHEKMPSSIWEKTAYKLFLSSQLNRLRLTREFIQVVIICTTEGSAVSRFNAKVSETCGARSEDFLLLRDTFCRSKSSADCGKLSQPPKEPASSIEHIHNT